MAEIKTSTTEKWTTQLQTLSKGAWTKRLLQNLLRGVNRRHGEVTFHLSQLITGHGCFNQFLHRIGRATSLDCSHCGSPDEFSEEEDDSAHTLFRCEAFQHNRERLIAVIGQFGPEDMVHLMLVRGPQLFVIYYSFT